MTRSKQYTPSPASRASCSRSYLQAGRQVCIPSRWCRPPCRGAARAGASPRHSGAGSGAPWCRSRCRPRTPAPRWARTSGSSRSPAPSPAGSWPAPGGTWTKPSHHRARRARTSPRTGTPPGWRSPRGRNSQTSSGWSINPGKARRRREKLLWWTKSVR